MSDFKYIRARAIPVCSDDSLRRSGCMVLSLDSQLRHLLLQALAMQAELSGGGGDVAVVVGEGGFDGGAFELFDE